MPAKKQRVGELDSHNVCSSDPEQMWLLTPGPSGPSVPVPGARPPGVTLSPKQVHRSRGFWSLCAEERVSGTGAPSEAHPAGGATAGAPGARCPAEGAEGRPVRLWAPGPALSVSGAHIDRPGGRRCGGVWENRGKPQKPRPFSTKHGCGRERRGLFAVRGRPPPLPDTQQGHSERSVF